MLDSPLPRVLSLAGARTLGVTVAQTRTELRRGRWRRIAPGIVLTRPDEPTRHDWINAAMMLGGPAGVLSGWDACRLNGLGAPRPSSQHVLVLTPRGHNRVVGTVHLRPSARAVGYRETAPFDDDLPAVRFALPARAVCDTALQLGSFAQVRALVTSAVQRGLATPADLATEFRAGPRNGSGLLRRALDDVIRGAWSIAEAEAIDLLRAARVPPFEVNAPVYDERGRLICTVDVLWPRLRAVLEIDSREFHFSEDEWKATMRRHNLLTANGHAVTHYPPSDIRRRRHVWAREVTDWLAARAAALGQPMA